MTLEKLELLDTLVKYKSVNKAAKHCYLNQSTLTRTLISIEKEVGFEIFERTMNGLQLTQRGEIFYNQTRKTIATYKAALENALKVNPAQTIRIGIYECLYKEIIEAVQYVSEQFPNIHFEYVSCSFPTVSDMLLNDKVDLCLLADLPEKTDKLFELPLFNAYNGIRVSYRHPFYHRESIELKELDNTNVLYPVKNLKTANLMQVSRIIKKEHPDIILQDFTNLTMAEVTCMMNNWPIFTLSILNEIVDFKMIPITDVPKVPIGLICLHEIHDEYPELIAIFKEYLLTHYDNKKVELY